MEPKTINDLWNLWPYGHKEEIPIYLAQTLSKTFKGKPVTIDFLFDQYEKYVSSLQPYQNGKYTKKEFRIITLDEWLDKELWKQDVTINNPLDFYLYGI